MTSLDGQATYDIVVTKHISAMELLAIIKGLEYLIPLNPDSIEVVTDLKSAAHIINAFSVKRKRRWYSKKSLYATMCNRLFAMLSATKVLVTAQWVPSDSPITKHVMVDRISKDKLKEFLLGE